MILERVFYICSALVILYACAVLAIDPAFADIVYDEDNFFENLTTALCAVGLMLSLAMFFYRLNTRRGYWFWLFMSVILFIFVGDEISWGMGYFGIEKKEIAGISFDGVHDILAVSIGVIKRIRDYILSMGLLDPRSLAIMAVSGVAILAASLLVIRLFVRYRLYIGRFFYENIRWRPFFFLLIALAMIALAMFIDEDNLVSFPHKRAVEESMELLAAVALLFSSFAGWKGRKDA
jgi:hypothetical protein